MKVTPKRNSEKLLEKMEKAEADIQEITKEAFKEIIEDSRFEFIDIDVKGCVVGYDGKAYYIEEDAYMDDTTRGRYGEYCRDFIDTEVHSALLTEKYLFIEKVQKVTLNKILDPERFRISRNRPQLRNIPYRDIILINDIISFCIQEIKNGNGFEEPEENYQKYKTALKKLERY